MNITLFIVSINLLKGEGPTRILELIGEVCFSLPPVFAYSRVLTDIVGLSSYYDCAAQVPPCRFDADVHCCAARSTGGVCECVWCDMGGVFESVRGSLNWMMILLLLLLLLLLVIDGIGLYSVSPSRLSDFLDISYLRGFRESLCVCIPWFYMFDIQLASIVFD